jgi:hypothetical protein
LQKLPAVDERREYLGGINRTGKGAGSDPVVKVMP